MEEIKKKWNSFIKKLGDLWQNFSSWLIKTWKKLCDFAKGLWNKVSCLAVSLWQKIVAKVKPLWDGFAKKNPKAAEWVREGGLFFLVSNLITIIRGILVTLLEPVFSFLGSGSVGFPNLTLNLFGIEFSWYIIGASESQGGAAYFTSFLIALWVCEIINFFMQRSFVFRSNGKMGRQALLYFLAFAVVTCIVNAVSNIWIGVASHFVPPLVYNLGTTFITGGVAMVVFFFANKLIFDSTLEKSEENHEEQNEEQVEDKI